MGSILVDVEGANLEGDLDKAVNESDDKVDSGQTREGEAIPLEIEVWFKLPSENERQDAPQA